MISKNELRHFLGLRNYDIRISNNGRWIDQKCTPDVLSIIADCVLDYVDRHGIASEFLTTDIWRSEYTENNVEMIFNKPNTSELKSQNEYDKFFSQPLELLAYSGILNKERRGRNNIYTVSNYNLLEYIAMNERFSVKFLIEYIQKVLHDSGLLEAFDFFFEFQTPETYHQLKDIYCQFINTHTKIKGQLEPKRIFTKVINPLAYSKRLRGTKQGRISPHPITYQELMYNRPNFRDEYSDKPKNITRREWELSHPTNNNERYYLYQSDRAKKFVRRYNEKYREGKSEINDQYSQGRATQMHHIFPQYSFPEISSFSENIIALTPTQHFNLAHPNNNTQTIHPGYQELCLKSKLVTIKQSLMIQEEESLYDFERFVHVLNVGFDQDFTVRRYDYGSVLNHINEHYEKYDFNVKH